MEQRIKELEAKVKSLQQSTALPSWQPYDQNAASSQEYQYYFSHPGAQQSGSSYASQPSSIASNQSSCIPVPPPQSWGQSVLGGPHAVNWTSSDPNVAPRTQPRVLAQGMPSQYVYAEHDRVSGSESYTGPRSLDGGQCPSTSVLKLQKWKANALEIVKVSQPLHNQIYKMTEKRPFSHKAISIRTGSIICLAVGMKLSEEIIRTM